MAPEYEEPHLIELGGDVSIDERKITNIYRVLLILDVEAHGCRLIHHAPVACEIVAVYAYLQCQHPECLEVQIHIAVNRQSRQRQYVLISRGLVGDCVVPVPDAEM